MNDHPESSPSKVGGVFTSLWKAANVISELDLS